MASFTAYIAQISRPWNKRALTASATALAATAASLCYVKNEREDPSALVLRRPLSLNVARCESIAGNTATKMDTMKPKSSDPTDYAGGSGNLNTVSNDEDGLYQGLFPHRQLWQPRLEYPLWDYEWDGRQPCPIDSNSNVTESQRERRIRKEGVTRHIILIRHGQYDETHHEDEKRILTPLGRKQAEVTGKRLGEYIRGVNDEFGPCNVKVVRVSNLSRAKETAKIIHDNLGVEVEMADPDPLLNEGRPCHHIPGGKARQSIIERTDEHHPRIEQAFRNYFYRADVPSSAIDEVAATPSGSEETETNAVATSSSESRSALAPHPKHEFEIIVCHANVIRYMFCRALQLPPEAWLRLCVFNCSLTYFTIRPTGTVSCRMLGDIGHLPYELSTFSMHTGFNW